MAKKKRARSREKQRAAERRAKLAADAKEAAVQRGKAYRSLFLKVVRSVAEGASASAAAVTELLKNGWRGGDREYQTLFGMLGSRGLWQSAAAVFNEMQGAPDVSTYCAAMRAFGKATAWELCLGVLTQMRRRDREPDKICYSALLLGLGKAGEWDRALRVLQDAQESGQLEDDLFEPLVAAGKQVVANIDEVHGPEVVLDMATYTAGVADVEMLADSKRVRQVLYDLRQREVVLDSSAYHSAITACTQGHYEERVEQLLFEAALGDTESQGGPFFYDTALGACSGSSNWQYALQLLDRHPAKSADSFSHVRSTCLLSGQWQLVLDLCGQLRQSDGKAAGTALSFLEDLRGQDLEPTVTAYHGLMTLSAKLGHGEQSAALLEAMRRDQLNPTATSYSTAMSACGEVELWPKAVALFEDLQRSGPPLDIGVCIAFIGSLQAAGEWELAVRFLQAMPLWGIEPDVTTYNAVLRVVESAGEWQWAVRLLEAMKSKGLEPDLDTYNLAIGTCDKGEQWEWALHLFNDVKKLGLAPNGITYGLTIAACNRCKQVEWAQRLTAEFTELNKGDDEVGKQLMAELAEHGVDEEWITSIGGDARDAAQPVQEEETDDEEVAVMDRRDQPISLEEKYEGAAALFRLAMQTGGFKPWLTPDKYDLHGMSVDVAETAVYDMLRNRLRKPEDHRDLWNAVTIIVGKGLHSEGEAVVGPAIEKLLKEQFKINFQWGKEDGSVRIPAVELQRASKLDLFSEGSS